MTDGKRREMKEFQQQALRKPNENIRNHSYSKTSKMS